MSSENCRFEYDRHVKYWLRCAKTSLPGAYASMDSSRMMLGFFIVSALDLLGVLQTDQLHEERAAFVKWIYQCQIPTGGFRGFTGSILGASKRGPDTEYWDPANVPATFLALITLAILHDDFSKVERIGCLDWLRKVQRQDGSFGETLGIDGSVEGGNDLRFCYCAAGVRLLLRGRTSEDSNHIPDINIKKLLSYIRVCQTFEGGFSQGPLREAHSGLTYCAIATLSCLNEWKQGLSLDTPLAARHGISLERTARWIVARQTLEIDDEFDDDETLVDSPETNGKQATPNISFAGFNGRQNKLADTCYAFWNEGALAILNRQDLIDKEGLRQYLLGKTQHTIGGFAKAPGDLPDLLHAYLGLASLAIIGEPRLPALDPTFCISKAAKANLANVSWLKAD